MNGDLVDHPITNRKTHSVSRGITHSLGVLVLIALFAPVALAQNTGVNSPAPAPFETHAPPKVVGAAVVELFTSQGCSSCPPADAVLRQLDADARKSEMPVYVLSFHVDYWNRLGWNDPYSDAKFSQRQRGYAKASGSRRVYTPQMIVNGTTEFVGSNWVKAHAAVLDELARQLSSKVSLKLAQPPAKGRIAVDYKVDGATSGHVLNVAVVQTPPANDVSRGENAGRKLTHVNVVRAFQTVSLDEPSGSVTLELPDDVDTSSAASVVAYVQNTKTLAVTGVTRIGADR